MSDFEHLPTDDFQRSAEDLARPSRAPLPRVLRRLVAFVGGLFVGVRPSEPFGLSEAEREEAEEHSELRAIPGANSATGATELIEELFDALQDLTFKESVTEGAEFVLDLASDYIPARAGLIHLYDINRAEFVVVAARGPRSGPLHASRSKQGDHVIGTGLRAEEPRQLPLRHLSRGAHGEDQSLRVRTLTPLRTVLIAPCSRAGQDVGAIELYDSRTEEEFSQAELNAAAYLSQALTTFVLQKGLVFADDEFAVSAEQGRAAAG